MPQTTKESWPKTAPRADIEKKRQANLDSGATSSVISETDTEWVLTTVWPTA